MHSAHCSCKLRAGQERTVQVVMGDRGCMRHQRDPVLSSRHRRSGCPIYNHLTSRLLVKISKDFLDTHGHKGLGCTRPCSQSSEVVKAPFSQYWEPGLSFSHKQSGCVQVRSPELEARLQTLQRNLDQKQYDAMVQDVTSAVRYPYSVFEKVKYTKSDQVHAHTRS